MRHLREKRMGSVVMEFKWLNSQMADELIELVLVFNEKWADSKLKNAWGVMLDDMFAGCFAAVVLLVVITKI